MQTKQEIERLLASAGVRPNKRLGQHFLIDLNLLRVLLKEADIRPIDVVLEVGCGTGSLTEELAASAGRLIGVEYDDVLFEIAEQRVKGFENTVLINADILESKSVLNHRTMEEIDKAAENFPGRFLLVANLPYNVSTPVLMNLAAGNPSVDAMYITVQKEVADRMAARPGSHHYGTLSIILSALGDVRILKKLKGSVFWPVPQVSSAMVSFVRDKKKAELIHDISMLREVVATLMGHRRKMLKSCVKLAEGRLAEIGSWNAVFEESFIGEHHRPEELTVNEYISIANLCYEELKNRKR